MRDMGSPFDSKTSTNVYSLLKLLVYRSLLLPVNTEEALDILKSLTYVLSLRDESVYKEVSAYIFRQFLSK